MFRHYSRKGFTLIELLVVVAIIGLLSSITLASLNNARGKAYNAVRFSDLRQVTLALELYSLNNNGSYPPATSANLLSNLVGVAPTYIRTIPSDPTGPTPYYYCTSSVTSYKLIASKSSNTNPNTNQPNTYCQISVGSDTCIGTYPTCK